MSGSAPRVPVGPNGLGPRLAAKSKKLHVVHVLRLRVGAEQRVVFVGRLFSERAQGRGVGITGPESVVQTLAAHPGDGRDFEALVRYMMRSPISLSRLRFTSGAEQLVYARKGGHDTAEPADEETNDADEFVARVLVQIPDPRRHLVRYYGAYSSRARGQRRKAQGQLQGNGSGEADELVPPPPERAALPPREPASPSSSRHELGVSRAA